MNIVIGHVALIQRTKKQDFVLRVIHELRKRGHDAIGLFSGECREPEFMRELEDTILKFELTDSVLFLGRRNDIPNLLKLMDVLMIPSFEGFPLAGLEAASAGVPVAACNVAGAKEFIEVSNSGCVFEEDNINEAVKVIIECCRNQSFAIDGRRFAEQSKTENYQTRIKDCFALSW